MSGMRIATFAVRADARTAVRWQRYAAAEGHHAVGSWLAATVERYLKLHSRPVPLFWRKGRFRVALECGEVEVPGAVSEPFATFRGTAAAPQYRRMGTNMHTLVYLEPGKAGRVIATVKYRRDARALAVQLSHTWMHAQAPPAPPLP